MIIAIYKTAFLVSCIVALACILVLGFLAVMNGMTPQDRWSSLSFMIGGLVSIIVLAGNLALQIENNELLRTIAEHAIRTVPALGGSNSALEASKEPSSSSSVPQHDTTV
jgi:Kef-type K+ transport system membrane component KefB